MRGIMRPLRSFIGMLIDKSRMTIADAIIFVLRELDLRYVFGVSGANIELLHDAIHRIGQGKLCTVMTKTESGAAFMADARARMHRTLGVCCATSGGGMMNLAVGVAESFAHSVPVLALVGQISLPQEGCGGFQDSSGEGNTINAVNLWKAIAKTVTKIDSREKFWQNFLDALTQPFVGVPGPSVLLLPRDVQMWEVGDPPAWFQEALHLNPSVPNYYPAFLYTEHNLLGSNPLLRDKLEGFWQMFRAAKKPLLILGVGVLRDHSQSIAVELVEETGLKVVTPLCCSNVFPQDNLHYLGMIGPAGHSSAHRSLADADLVIAVGSQFTAMALGPLAALMPGKCSYVINRDIEKIDPVLAVKESIPISTLDFFQWLLAKVRVEPLRFQELNAFVREYVEPTVIEYQVAGVTRHAQWELRQSEALRLISQYLPEKGYILIDAGNCAAAAAHYLQLPPKVQSHIALGMGGMGYAVAGAIGAQLGSPEDYRTTVICGDGAFLMAGMEVHTAVDFGLPVLWVVFNNNMHGMCVTRQFHLFNGRYEGNTYSQVNIAQVARGFGDEQHLWVGCATNKTELNSLLSDYFNQSRAKAGVLELKIGIEELPPMAFQEILMDSAKKSES